MTTPTFTPPIAPTPGMKNKPEIALLKADFGDGYTQVAPRGINNVRKVYDMSWDVLFPDEADEIIVFLEQQKGSNPFFFIVPGTSKQVKFTCETWSDQTNAAGFRAVTATFRQNFSA